MAFVITQYNSFHPEELFIYIFLSLDIKQQAVAILEAVNWVKVAINF